jgi:hypothetical protein
MKDQSFFAYFVQGGSGQVLDNAHGNVFFGVANGTACTLHSLAWDDPEDKKDACNAIRTSTQGQEIDLPKPPDHIMGPRGAPTTCLNQHGASRSYSFGQI